ncbi:hypothetical protein Vretimale_14981, partial [Volvox reticuliferus]
STSASRATPHSKSTAILASIGESWYPSCSTGRPSSNQPPTIICPSSGSLTCFIREPDCGCWRSRLLLRSRAPVGNALAPDPNTDSTGAEWTLPPSPEGRQAAAVSAAAVAAASVVTVAARPLPLPSQQLAVQANTNRPGSRPGRKPSTGQPSRVAVCRATSPHSR